MSSNYRSNCYLIVDKEVALIDSGNPPTILKKIDRLNIGIDYLISTHCHYDHIAGLFEIREKVDGLMAAHEIDAEAMERGDRDKILSDMFGVHCPKLQVDIKLKDGDSINLGNLDLQVIHTPGHSEGSICLYEPRSKSLFSGDTIFADSIGRTDLPGGSLSDLRRSIERLIRLHHESGIKIIYPGHGPLGNGEDIEKIYKMYLDKPQKFDHRSDLKERGRKGFRK